MPNTCVNYEKKCGGCPLLALPYREQLAQKQARLQELLGGFAPVKAVQGMAEPLHYRNKAIASFATQRGKLVSVDNQPTIEATTAAIEKALGLE